MSALRAREWNKGAPGAPVVLLHGFGTCADVWAPIAERLECPVIAFDMPGHRFSPLAEGKAPAREAAKGVVADLEARGVSGAVLGGHSLGGAAAVLAALAAPNRFSRLVLVAPGGMGETIAEPLMMALASAAGTDALREALAAMSALGAPSPRADVLAALVAMREEAGASQRLASIARQLAAGGRQGVIPPDRLAAIPQPVSVLWGTADPVLPFTQTQGLPDGWVLQSVPGAGHMLLEEAPEAVLSALRATPAI